MTMNDVKLRAVASRGRGLSPPLRRFLRLSVDERVVQNMWQVIAARSAPELAVRHRTPWLPAWAFLMATGLVVLGFLVLQRPSAAPSAGVLLTSDGHQFESLEAALEDGVKTAALADGSRIEVSPGARVETLASTPSELVLLVRRGRVRFSVTPGGPRRWLIETPGARVEVVGTILSVDAAGRAVHVHVEKGAVLVRSQWLAEGVRRLEAGQSLGVAPPEPVPAQKLGSAPAEPSGVAVEPHEPPAPPPAGERRPASTARTAPDGGRTAPDGGHAARQLWTEADAARQVGEPAAAARLLERLLSEHPGEQQAALAAFTLGTLYADHLGQPGLAARAFRRALALGIPAVLRDTCYVRWAESARAVGDVPGVRSAVEEYAKKYPAGDKRSSLQALLGEATRAK
jgi:transmembrane sensor